MRYSEVKIHYLKYFGMLPSSVNLLTDEYIYIIVYIYTHTHICI